MTSLTDAYESEGRTPRRVYAGTALVLAGAVLAICGVLVATTDLFGSYGSDQFGAIKLASMLAGVAVPVVLVGVFTVLPSGRRTRAAAAIGASLCLFGVALFSHAYPAHWRGYGDDLTLHVSVIYLLGLFIAIWCLFAAVVNFKTRNDPGGMLEMNVTRQGRTKVVEVDRTQGFSGVGFLGGTPDGDVETQTASNRSGQPKQPASPASDGGATTADIRSPLDSTADSSSRSTSASASTSSSSSQSRSQSRSRPQSTSQSADANSIPTDRYCGSCEHFRYVRSSSGMVPYCEFHEEAMSDMDACEEWTPNT